MPNETTESASPRPWSVEVNRFGQCHILDAAGGWVCGPIGPEKRVVPGVGDSNAALIVEAVNERDSLRAELYNTRLELAHAVHSDELAGKACREWAEEYRALRAERDRLRDIVRRLYKSMQEAADVIRADTEHIGPFAPDVILRGVNIAELLREARSAIGEGA